MKRDQTAEVQRRLLEGTACGRTFYLRAIPNGRTRAGEIAKRLGKVLASEPCKHRNSDEPAYRDYRLEEPAISEQLALLSA